MASVQIGAVRVSLGLDSAQFSQGLKGANTGMKSFTLAAAAGFAAVSAAAASAFAAIKGAANRADDAWKASQSIGIPIKDLGRLSYAAEMSGASFETLSTGVRKASQAIIASARGASNDATKALQQLGVTAKTTDGKLRPTIDVMGDIAEQFSKMPDGAAKTNLAMAIFGKTGAALIPTLNMGREGLKAMGDEAERMGLVFDEKTARAAEGFNDNLMRLNLSFTGLWNRVLAGVIPAFEGLSNKIVAAFQNGQVLDVVVGSITVAMNLLTKGIGFVVDNLDFLISLFKVFVAAKLITFVAAIAGSFITFAKSVRVVGLAMTLVTSITKMKITAILTLAAAIGYLTGTLDDMVVWVENVGKALVTALPESLRNGIDELSGGLFNLGTEIDSTNTRATEMLATYLRVGSEAPGAFGTATKGVTDIGIAVADTKTKVQTFAESLSPLKDAFTGMFSGLTNALRTGADAWGFFADAGMRALDSLMDKAIGALASGVFDMILGAFTGGIGGGFGIGSMITGLFGLGGKSSAGKFSIGNMASYDGGGFTGFGSRSGGLDGKGGFPALLHPNETVVDHSAGGDTFNIHVPRDATVISMPAAEEIFDSLNGLLSRRHMKLNLVKA